MTKSKSSPFAISSRRFLSATIFDQPKKAVENALQFCLSRIVPDRFSSFQAPVELTRIYEIEPPAGSPHLKNLLLFSPRSNPKECVLICNLRDGWASLSWLLAKELKSLQIRISSTPQGAEYPQSLFELWQAGQSIRLVMAMRDSDKWVFVERGATQPFEEPDLYKKFRKKARLERETLVRYSRRIGWDIAEDDFWTSDEPGTYFAENAHRAP